MRPTQRRRRFPRPLHPDRRRSAFVRITLRDVGGPVLEDCCTVLEGHCHSLPTGQRPNSRASWFQRRSTPASVRNARYSPSRANISTGSRLPRIAAALLRRIIEWPSPQYRLSTASDTMPRRAAEGLHTGLLDRGFSVTTTTDRSDAGPRAPRGESHSREPRRRVPHHERRVQAFVGRRRSPVELLDQPVRRDPRLGLDRLPQRREGWPRPA